MIPLAFFAATGYLLFYLIFFIYLLAINNFRR